MSGAKTDLAPEVIEMLLIAERWTVWKTPSRTPTESQAALQGMDQASLAESRMTSDAVERCVERIYEAAHRLKTGRKP